ncbi:MAG: sensor histidine kinase [Fidelibacterota bacterium]|nr:MAG: sensor histidine kinase [Candidatus Neomarinimicrobiota bacterium]
MKVEITKALSLSDEQTSLLEMHSMLNIMNVLVGEFYQIGHLLGNKKLLKESISHCSEIVSALSDRRRAIERTNRIDTSKQLIRDNIRSVLDAKRELFDSEQIQEHTSNIESIFNILDVRVRELLARAKEPEMWIRHEIRTLTTDFINVFTAIERNAKGRYRIVYNIASKHSLDYFVNFNINSIDGDTIYIPAVLHDVMRDLIANARKYTDLGGTIIAGLDDDGEYLCYVVEDNGRGIPSTQIEQVVDYGVRAENVKDKETKGGGFGLTKAYFITRQFNGRMWIESEESQGTIITIHIPSRSRAGSR